MSSPLIVPLGTPDICDNHKNHVQVLPPHFVSFGGKKRMQGTIETLKIQHNNVSFWDCLRADGTGKVLVVDALAEVAAVMGDQMASLAINHGWQGVIINGYIRDSATIGQLPLGVWALGTYPMKGDLNTTGQRQIPLSIDGLTIHPGHHVYADEDGIVIHEQPLPAFEGWF